MSGRRGAISWWIGVGVAVLAVAVLVAGGANEEPLDPRSTADDGAKALVDLASSFGAEVEIGVVAPGADHDVAVLLADTFGRDDRAVVEQWVRTGGRLLVTDAGSPLSPRTGPSAEETATGQCADPALRQLRTIEGTRVRLRAPADGVVCVDGAVAVDPLGDGVVVSIGTPTPLLNDHLDRADNSVLAVSVLAPVPGTTVAVLESRLVVGAGGERLRDLVPDPLWVLLAQLGVGFLIIAWWRARRLGGPVAETQPVAVEGSELTAARGRLMASIRRPDTAASELRQAARRHIQRRLGLPPEADADQIAARVAPHAGVAPDVARTWLADGPVHTDDELVALAAGLARLRQAVDTASHRPRADLTTARGDAP